MKSTLFALTLLSAFTALKAGEAPIIKQKTYNFGKIESEKMGRIYPGFSDSFDKALIVLPKGFEGLEVPFYGTLEEVKTKFPNLERITKTYPSVLK